MKSRHFIGLFMIGILALANNPMAKTVECEHTVAISKTNKTLNAYKGGGRGVRAEKCFLPGVENLPPVKDNGGQVRLYDCGSDPANRLRRKTYIPQRNH